MLLDKLRDRDDAIWPKLSAQPASLKFLRSLCQVPKRLPRCDHNPPSPLDSESVVTGGRVPVVRVVSLERWRTEKGWGVKRKSPHRVGVFEFPAAGVSSHYFSSPDSSLQDPTGMSVMDRYILLGITGMKKEENNQRGSPSSIIFSLHRDYSHMELKGRLT